MKFRSRFLVPVLFCLAAFSARGNPSYTWTGSVSGDPLFALNWLEGLPVGDGTEDFVFGDGATATSILVPIPGIGIHNISFTGTARPIYSFSTLGGPITLTGNLTLTGSTTAVTIAAPIVLNSTFSATHTVDILIGATVTVSGTVSGSGNNIVKSGGGTLLLSGDNTFSGLTVNAGTLLVGSGTFVDESQNIISGPVGTGPLTLNDGATLAAASDTNPTLANEIIVSGNVTIGDLVNMPEFRLNGSLSGSGSISAFSHSDGEHAARVVLGSSGTNSFSGSVTFSGDGALELNGHNVFSGLTITGGGSVFLGNSTRSGESEVSSGSFDTGPAGIGAISFTDAYALIPNGTDVSLANNLFVSGPLEIDLSVAHNLSLGGTIADGTNPGSLNIYGPGNLTLAGANTFSGGANLRFDSEPEQGAYVVLDSSSTGTAGPLGTGLVTLESGATLVAGLDGVDGVTLDNDIAMTGDATFGAIENDNNLSLTGTISGIGGMLKLGGGTLTLSGANTYSGGTTIDAGSIRLASTENYIPQLGEVPAHIDSGPLGRSTVTTMDGATISVSDSIASVILHNDFNLFLEPEAGNETTLNTGASDLALLGTISESGDSYGVGSLVKLGTGSLKLAGANTFQGGVLVTAGKLIIGRSSDAPDGIYDGPVGLGQLTLFQDTVLATDGSFTLHNGITLFATGEDPGLVTIDTGASILSLLGDIDSDGGAGMGLAKVGSGTLVLAGYSSYAGGTTVNEGTISLDNSSVADGDFAPVIWGPVGRGPLTMLDGTTLKASADGDIHLGNDIVFGPGNITIDSGIPLDNNDYNLRLTGQLSGEAHVDLIGTGILALEESYDSANVDWTGGLTITDAGTIWFDSNTALGTGPVTLSGVGALLDIRTGDPAIGSLSGVAGSSIDLDDNNLTINQTVDGEFAGRILDYGSVRKIGAGKLTLSGANEYDGSTTISAGTLAVSILVNGGFDFPSGIGNSGSSPYSLVLDGGTLEYIGPESSTDRLFTVTDAPGSTLAASGTGAITFSNTGSISFSSESNHTFTLSGTSTALNTFTPIITDYSPGVTSLVKNGAGTWVLAGANTFSGGTTINDGQLRLDISNALASGRDVTINSLVAGHTAILALNSGVNQLVGSLTFGGTGATSTSENEVDIGGSGTLTMGGDITYLATNNPKGGKIDSGTLDLNGTRTLNVADSTNDSVDFTIDSVIAGSGLIKSGAGVLDLYRNNTYTGATTISGGAIELYSLTDGGAASTLGSSSNAAANLVLDSGTIRYVGSTASTDRLFTIGSGGATLDVSGSGSVTFSNIGSLAYGAAGTARTLNLTGSNAGANTLASVVADNGSGATSLIKSGTGTWILAGADFYSGGTTISAGTLQIGDGAGSGSVIGNIVDNATLLFNRSGSIGYSGIISGAGTVTKNNTNTLTLTGFSTYTGGTTINAGTLQIGNGGSAGDISGNIVDNGTLTVARSDSYTIFGNISGTGSVFNISTGITFFNGTNTYTGPTSITNGGALSVQTLANGGASSGIGSSSSAAANLVLDGGSLRFTGASPGTDRLFTIGVNGATLNMANSSAFAFTNTGTLAFAGAPSARTLTLTGSNLPGVTFSPLIADNGAGVTSLAKDNIGVWILTNANTFTGATTISNGTLTVGNPLALQNSTLNYDGGQVNFAGVSAATLGNLSGSQPLTLTNTSSAAVALSIGGNNSTTSFSGLIAGIGSLLKAGSGTVTLSNTSTYSGSTTVNSGTLVVGATNALPTGTALSLAGGTFDVQNNQTVSSLAGSAGTVSVASGKVFTVSGASTTSFDGSISGAGSLVKAGTGTLALNAANTYAGGTTLSGGTLVAGNAASLGTGAITLNGGKLQFGSTFTVSNAISFGAGGGTLSGVGTYSTPITVGANVVLSPGNSPGTLTFSAGLTLASAGSITFEVQDATGTAGTGYDLVSVSGALAGPGTSIDVTATSGSPFTIHLVSLNGSSSGNAANFNSAAPVSWTLATAANGISGFSNNNFAFDLAGFTNGTAGGGFSIGSTGTALTLNFTPVPEPSTWALMIAGSAALAGAAIRRRRRR